MACLTSVTYTMQADIYQPTIQQDATGAVIKTYTFEKTIDCYARTDIKKGSGDNSTAVNINEYLNYLNSVVKLRAQEAIPVDRKIVRIRNSSGVIWTEDQDSTSGGGYQGSTIFEARGSTPVLNFDGSVIEYDILLLRQENQRWSWWKKEWTLEACQKK